MTTKQLPDAELLTKAACRRLGLTRPDVDRMFERCPTITLPEGRTTYIERDVFDGWMAEHRAAGEVTADVA